MINRNKVISSFLNAKEEQYEFDRKDAWGYLASIDVINGNPKKIQVLSSIEDYIKGICNLIKCHPYGSPTIARIGEGKALFGWSFTQLVTTSSITGHFVDSDNAAFIDIFYCDYFNPDEAVKFTVNYFEAKLENVRLLTRGHR
jgi:S-adenosylmethionine decarboxylase